jgi:hypothetical protein
MKRTTALILIILLTFPLLAFDFFFDDVPQRNISFELEGGVQTYFDDGAITPLANLTLKAEQDGANYRAIAEVSYDSQTEKLEAQELSVSLFMGSYTLKAGLMRHSWGTADVAHVVDIVNGRDLRKGIIDDLEKMKRPDWMITLSKYWENSAFDVVLKPGFNPSLVAEDGKFSIEKTFQSNMKFLEKPGVPPFTMVEPLPIAAENTYELSKLSAGARYRFLFDPVEVGLLYYYGYFHDSGFKPAMDFSNLPLEIKITGVNIHYTRYHFIGVTSSYFFEPFTFAFEGGMFLSEDNKGTIAELYNSKLVYLGELSYTNPNNSLFMAFNYQGQMILNYDPESVEPDIDVDLFSSFNFRPYQNNFTLAIEVPFFREKMKARLAGMYQLESTGYTILAALSYEFDDNVSVFGKSTVYGTIKDRMGLYNTWKDNSWIQVGVRAWF